MGKSPIPKTDYVMYFIGLRVGILPEVSIVSIYPCVIPVEAYLGGVQGRRSQNGLPIH